MFKWLKQTITEMTYSVKYGYTNLECMLDPRSNEHGLVFYATDGIDIKTPIQIRFVDNRLLIEPYDEALVQNVNQKRYIINNTPEEEAPIPCPVIEGKPKVAYCNANTTANNVVTKKEKEKIKSLLQATIFNFITDMNKIHPDAEISFSVDTSLKTDILTDFEVK